MNYQEFIDQKQLLFKPVGFEPPDKLNKNLFKFQDLIVRWAIRKGRACLFEGCGLGKTLQQLEWARLVHEHENGPVLILAPLAVAIQTQQEGHKFGIPVKICQNQDDVINGINITNYEKLHKFKGSEFPGIVCDESGILKSFTGYYRNEIIESFQQTPYRLSCTATPAPNDYIELGNHAEFLGIMTYTEMLSMFFINDTKDTGTWRLKKHASELAFWKWLCSWAIMINNPSDLGFIQDGFDLPLLNYQEHVIPSTRKSKGFLVDEAATMQERRQVRKETIKVRCAKCLELVKKRPGQWVIWCDLNTEQAELEKLFNDRCSSIHGSLTDEHKIERFQKWLSGNSDILISKPQMFGYGLNLQQSCNTAFVGLSDSWEQLYQAIRRLWRFGQVNPVNAHIIIEEREGSVLKNIKRKDRQAEHMQKSMIGHVKEILKKEITETEIGKSPYEPDQKMKLPKWI